jgi:hypothetical protein
MLSYPENIPVILEVVQDVSPKSVIDIGAGFGKYGLLIREQYLSNKTKRGDLLPVDDIRIDAVEDTKYFTDRELFWQIYDDVYTEPLDFMLKHCAPIFKHRQYELALLIDVIEHWTVQDAAYAIRELSLYCGNILISTPKDVSMYKEHFYGDSRHHITQYHKGFLSTFGMTNYKEYDNELSWIWLIRGDK